MINVKRLLYEDKEKNKIISYRCRKRDISNLEAEYCFSSLYGMKLTSSVVNTNVLKEGNGTNDLIKELRKIFEDDHSSIINLESILNLFDMSKVTPSVIMEPIKKLLGMYDVEKASEISKEELLESIEETISSEKCETLTLEEEKEALQSIKANTEALKDINLKKYVKRK